MLSIQGVILKIDAYRSFWHALYYFLSAKNTLYGSEKKFLNSFLCLLLLIFYLLYDVIGKYIFNRTKIEQISKWHWTQEQLAEQLNISTSNLGKLERGLQGLSIDLLIEIGIFFGVGTDYILLGCSIQPTTPEEDIDSMIRQLIRLKQKI